MITLTVTRKRKFAGALMPFWIVAAEVTEAAPERFQTLESARINELGRPEPVNAVQWLDQNGVRIKNGETVTVELEDGVTAVYAVTMDGLLSNRAELPVDGKLTLTVRGGFAHPQQPYFET